MGRLQKHVLEFARTRKKTEEKTTAPENNHNTGILDYAELDEKEWLKVRGTRLAKRWIAEELKRINLEMNAPIPSPGIESHSYLDALLQNPEYPRIRQIQRLMWSKHSVADVAMRKGLELSWGLQLERGDKGKLLAHECINEIPIEHREEFENVPENSWVYIKDFVINLPNEYLRVKK